MTFNGQKNNEMFDLFLFTQPRLAAVFGVIKFETCLGKAIIEGQSEVPRRPGNWMSSDN
jgi:hypothetical protein